MTQTPEMRGAVRWRLAGAAAFGLFLAAAGAAGATDWSALSAVKTVTITTQNEDGSMRDTTVWLLVLDGNPYVRTGNTSWGENVMRNPNVKLGVGGRDFILRAVPVVDPALATRIQEGFREKYGWQDAVVGLIPGGGSKLFRLQPRPGS